MTTKTPANLMAHATPRFMPRSGYRGWVCTCGARAERDRYIPHAFTCERPNCDSQRAEWIDEVQA